MYYIEGFKSAIFGCARDVQRYAAGDKSDYVYLAGKSEELGTFDKNHKNRARICYALLYDVCETADKKEIVRELFREELEDRETNSFQGIGDNLEMLTSMLLELGEPLDSELFKRAKNANFDCACGYEPRVLEAQPLDEFSLYDCISVLDEIGETELMFKLTDDFKSGELDLKGVTDLKSIAKWHTKRDSDLEYAAKRACELFRKFPELFDMGSAFDAVYDYAELLIKSGDTENASSIFNEHKETLKQYKRKFYVLGARLIASGAAAPEKLWADIKPYIARDLGNDMVAPINRDVILAASELANDREMTKRLSRYFEKRDAELRR